MTRLLAALALGAALGGLAACDADRETVPDAARVTCTESGVVVETPVVRPRPDGIHVVIVNETDAVRSLTLRGDDIAGFGARPGETEEVADLGPGDLIVRCERLTAPKPGRPLTIADPEGLWVSTELPCPDQISMREERAGGAKGETSDPLEAARKALHDYGLQPDDVVERAGYPEDETPTFRLVRDGVPSLTVELSDDGEGRWLAGWVTACGGPDESP